MSSNTSSAYTNRSTSKTKAQRISKRKKQTKNSKFRNVDPIDAFNVFTSDDLEHLSSRSSSVTPDIDIPTQKRVINTSVSTDSENEVFYPKTQIVRKVSQSARKTKSNTTLKSTPKKVSRLSNENEPETNPIVVTPKKTTPVSKTNEQNSQSSSATISQPFVEMRLNSPKKNSPISTGQKQKIDIISSTVLKKSTTIHNSQEAGPSTGNKISVCRNIFGTNNSDKTITVLKDYDVNVKLRDKTLKGKLNISEEKILISIDLTDKNMSMDNTEDSSSTELETTPEKFANYNKQKQTKLVETPTKSPKKIKPKDAKNYKEDSSSTELETTPEKYANYNKQKQTKLVETPTKSPKKINPKGAKTYTEDSSSTELETTPDKFANYNQQKKTKLVETPTKSPKKIKPKDAKTYTQCTLNNFMKNTKPTTTSKTDEIAKNKSNVTKTNSKYTLETNTRLYENVENIIKWVFDKEHFNILFTKNETDLLCNFFKLSDTKLTILCLRLFTRQHKWYNLTNLCTELNLKGDSYNYQDVLTHLDEVYVYSDYTDETIDVLLDHLSAVDLRDICNSFKITAPTRKEAMLRKLLDYASKQCTLTFVKNSDQILRDRIEEKLGICVKLKHDFKNVLYMVHLLYSITKSFASINDIYNTIYQIKSNSIKYPAARTDTTKIFADRKDFLSYSEATLLRKEYDDQFLKKDIGSQYLLCVEAHKRLLLLLDNAQQVDYDTLKPLFLRRFSASWIYCKVLSNGSLNLGKHYSQEVCEWLTDMLKQYIYCLYKRGQWYIQLSLINQSHLKKFVEAADTIIAGINDKDVTEVTKNELSIRGSKIRKTKLPQLKFDELQYALLPKLTIPVERTFEAKAIYRNEQGRKLYFERITEEGKEYASVEETAINYYKEHHNYTDGCHCEGRLLTTLFIVFFWDILYEMNIPNTFISEIQSFPLDLFSTDFYTNRKAKINERLNDIRNKWNLKNMCDFFSSKFTAHTAEMNSVCGFQCEEKTFHEIIHCITKDILAAVFERLAKDYKQFQSGLPDLFLWNKRAMKCAFVEVKSENDILSTRQILWINYLHSFHACVEVCHVLNKGSKKNQKKFTNQEI